MEHNYTYHCQKGLAVVSLWVKTAAQQKTGFHTFGLGVQSINDFGTSGFVIGGLAGRGVQIDFWGLVAKS